MPQHERTDITSLILIAAIGCALPRTPSVAADWVRAGVNAPTPRWGMERGLQFGLHPGGTGRADGPRGLIRLRYPALSDGGYDLINFIAVEPVVKRRRGLSELERSQLDGAQGKRIWAVGTDNSDQGASPSPGKLTTLGQGVEQLEVTLRVERFDNGAHVGLVLTQRSDRPDELALTVRAEPDSAALDACVLTATMGNKIRARQLWLQDEVVSSLRLYPDYKTNDFAPIASFPLDRLKRTLEGDVIVALTTNEERPADVYPFPGTRLWHYGGAKVTQYWRKPKAEVSEDLRAVVNGRYVYWNSQQPVPGGIAFENFELQERFREGQTVIFGITRRTPAELGFQAKP
jgi:hypothetical protein